MMKRIFFCILFLTSLHFTGFSQTYVKFNSLYWLVGIPNASVETRLGNHFTYNHEVVASLWKGISGNPLMFGQFIPEVRYFPRRSFDGFYVGYYASGHVFKMSKWNHFNSSRHQKGWGLGTGLNLGYEARINDRWLLDVYASGGYTLSRYRAYDKRTGERCIELNNSAEWMPYRVGITFAYRLSRSRGTR